MFAKPIALYFYKIFFILLFQYMPIEIIANSLEVRGVILGGGKGTRLHPLTTETSKHLLPVGNKPLIFYPINQLLEAGVKDLLLLIDDRHASQYMQLLQDGKHLGINSLAYVWQPREGKGLPSAIAQVEPFVRSGKMIVVCGDVIIENGLSQPVKDFAEQTSGARIVATYTEDTAGYSLLETHEDRILNIWPKDETRHISGLIDLGVYMYTSEVFEFIRNLTPSTRGETEIWDLNKIYVQRQQLYYSKADGWWSDVGSSLDTYLAANERYAKTE